MLRTQMSSSAYLSCDPALVPLWPRHQVGRISRCKERQRDTFKQSSHCFPGGVMRPAYELPTMARRSLSRWVEAGLIGLFVSAIVQTALIEICVSLSAKEAAMGLASIPTLSSFVGAVLMSLEPRSSRRALQLLLPALAFFLTGLVAYRSGLPYGAPGIFGAALVLFVMGAPRGHKNKTTLPSGITNYPRPKLIEDAGETERLSSTVASMPHACSLKRLGRSLIRQLREQAEEGKIALVLSRSDADQPLATVGSYDPISLEQVESERSVSWESCLICFGLDAQSLSPYTSPAALALNGLPQVCVPPALAHGLWAVVCQDPGDKSARSMADSLWGYGWFVDSPQLGLSRRIAQLACRRHSPKVLISSQADESLSHDLVLWLCSASARLADNVSGAILLPFTEQARRFLPSSLSQMDPSPRPLMILGNKHVLEWRDGRWV